MNHDKPDLSSSLAGLLSRDHKQLMTETLRRAGEDYVSRRKVTLRSVEASGTGLLDLKGSVQCGFGIVHHPALTLAGGGGQIWVQQHQCDCRDGARGRFCAHGAALLLAHYGYADGGILAGESVRDRTEGQIQGIRVRLGTLRKTGEPVYWTPEDAGRLATANIAIIGGEDMGNTQMAQSVALQLLRQKAEAGEDLGLLIFDGLDDYNDTRTDFVEAIGARVLRLYRLPVNPFSLRGLERKPQLHVHTAMAFADSLARAYGLGALQKSTLVQSVVAAYAARGITSDPLTWDLPAPSFADVYEEYCSRPLSQRSDALAPVMENLSALELFDTEAQEVSFYGQLQGAVILDLSGYPEELKQFAVSLVLELLNAQMCGSEKTLGRALRRMILVDNADSLLAAGSPGLEGLLSRGREYDLGVLLSAHSIDGFRTENFDYRRWVRTWQLHNVEDLRKGDLEFLMQIDIHDGAMEPLYQASRHLRKLHSLIRIGTEEPVLAEDLPFYEIAGDTRQSYLIPEKTAPEPELLTGMPLLDTGNPDALVTLEEELAAPMAFLEELK